MTRHTAAPLIGRVGSAKRDPLLRNANRVSDWSGGICPRCGEQGHIIDAERLVCLSCGAEDYSYQSPENASLTHRLLGDPNNRVVPPDILARLDASRDREIQRAHCRYKTKKFGSESPTTQNAPETPTNSP